MSSKSAILQFKIGIVTTILLMAACSPLTSRPPTEQPSVQLGAITNTKPAPDPDDTLNATSTQVVPQQAIGELQQPTAGVIYRNQEGLWQVMSDGQSQLLTGQADAVPSPDLSLAYLYDFVSTSLTLIDLKSGQEKVILTDPLLNGLFTWAGNETILFGLYLSPMEADGPNYGHLASLDVGSGTFSLLDDERLMVSTPARSPDGMTIAYSSDGPYLYREDGGTVPFPNEEYSGLTGVQLHMSPSWSPDGRYLAWIVSGGPFGDDPDLTMGLAIYDLEMDTATLRLSFDPARWGATPPAAVWSPDGNWLALRVFANGEEDSGLWVLDVDGLEDHYIPGISGNANYPVWSPDSQKLLYLDYADEDEPPYSQLLIFDLHEDISHPVDITTGVGVLWLAGTYEEETSTEVPSTPSPIGADPICRQVSRPALLLFDRGQYYITNFKDRDACPFAFPGELPGLIQSGGEDVYFHDMDFTTQDVVVKRLAPNGEETTLPFTKTALPAQFLHYVVSPDGEQIAWSTSRVDDSGQPVSDLWFARTDGSAQAQILTGIPGIENRFVVPIRFSPDGRQLYYAMQPIGVGGSWIAFNGRHDSLYSIPTSGGQPSELFQCTGGHLLCLGDFAGEGEALKVAYTDSAAKTIYLTSADGETISQFSFPDADFLGYPTFGPNGELAFSVVTVDEHADGYPIPQPGAIYFVPPPYVGEPQLVKSDDSIATLIGWLDSERLVYNSVDPGGNWGTVVTSLTGNALIWGPGPAQFITILQ